MFRRIVSVVAVACAVLGGFVTSVMAEGMPIPVPDNGMDFSSVVTTITTQLFPVLAMAGGLGLAIWIVTMLFRKFKAMGR